jgi:hypothetical protein
MSMREWLKNCFKYLRVLAGRFVIIPRLDDLERSLYDHIRFDTIIRKAALTVSSECMDGDYLEFGVYQGASFIKAYHSLREIYVWRFTDSERIHSEAHRQKVRQAWEQMRFFAFDSFEGLPAPMEIDQQTENFTKGKYVCAEDVFRANLKASDVDLGRVVTVPGFFDQTCNAETARRHNLRKACVVHIDCDYYDSTRAVLNFIRPLIQDGTILIFDDWFCYKGNRMLGEQRAFYEWLSSMPDWTATEYQREGHSRNSFIMNRNLPASGDQTSGMGTRV